MIEQIRQFLRENPRAWIVGVAALLTLILVAWGVYGGFSLEFGRFFAAEPPSSTLSATPSSVAPGETVTLRWSSLNATECIVTAGNFGPINTSGTATEAISPAFTGTAQFRIRCTGPGGTADSDIASVTVSAGGVGFPGAAVKPTPTQLREYARAQGWSEDFERFSDAVLQDWINCCWNVQARKFNSRRAGVEGLWEKPTECPAGQVPAGPNETDPCITLAAPATPTPATPTPSAAPTTTPPIAPSSCADLLPDVFKCHNVHTCMGRSDAVCPFSEGELSNGLYYQFYDYYRAPDGTSYLFNWRSKKPPENDPTAWQWFKVPNQAQAWCAPTGGFGPAVTPPTTNLHTIFDPMAAAGRFACPIGKVGAYNQDKNPAGIDCPAAEKAYFACRAAMNDATPTPTVTANPSAIPSPTAAPSGPLQCAPASQTIPRGQLSDHSATGGTGTYTWSAYPGAVQEAAAPGYATYSWLTAGTKTVTVTSGGQTAQCTVIVTSGTGTQTPFTVAKTARNTFTGSATDIKSGESVEVSITISAPPAGGIFRISDEIPDGTSYVDGSARRDLSRLADPSVRSGEVSFEGIGISGGSSSVIRYRITADRTDTVRGRQTGTYAADIVDTKTGASNGEASVVLTVFGTGADAPGDVTQVPTGPGDAILFALMVAAAASLLYSAYTRSAAFRSREVTRIGRDQGPMDFRS